MMRVVAAVIEDADGRFLLAQRPKGKSNAGLWEFPGGKLEPGELPQLALQRELREELEIEIEVVTASRLMRVRSASNNRHLVLEAWRVCSFQGIPKPVEHAALSWCSPEQALCLALCPADVPIARALRLPACYAITPEPEAGASVEAFLARIEEGLQAGVRMVQWRAPSMKAEKFRDIAVALREMTRRHEALLMLNSSVEIACELGADGVHLSSSRLLATSARPVVSTTFLVAASCHDQMELAHASALGVDFVVVSPVRPTSTHPGAEVLGWSGFRSLCDTCDLPVYALGGLGPSDQAEARAHGAMGIAGISAFW